MSHKTKWIATKGTYQIDRIEQTEATLPYRNASGQVVPGVTIPATRLVAFAGDVAVIGVTVAGNHSQTLANWRGAMAQKIQDEGGSWMGRTEESENARADRITDMMHDPKVNPDAESRRNLQDAYYNSKPHPSSY